jgi:hypothetical protein
MNVSRFVERTAAFIVLLNLLGVVFWFAMLKPTIAWWGELGFKALLIPIVVVSLFYLFVNLYNWATDVLFLQGDLNDDGKLNLAEWVLLAKLQFEDLRKVRDALNKEIDREDARKNAPIISEGN